MSYYSLNAQDFFDSTVNVDMAPLYGEFVPLLEENCTILDAGCGSGRDSKAFKELGFTVHAIDSSKELAELAEREIGQFVEVTTFQDFKSTEQYGAIWACASLLHVPLVDLPSVFQKLSNPLKINGIFYCSFKYGDKEVERNGRHFTDLNESLLEQVLAHAPLKILKTWRTADLRVGRESEQWLNAILTRV